MQIGKLWTAGLAIAFGVLLAACYDNNGNSTTAGGGTLSTNNIAPSGITNANFALQYTSGPLVSTIDSLQLSGNGTFTRTPTLSLTGLASSGSYSTPLLDALVVEYVLKFAQMSLICIPMTRIEKQK